ncbi:coiled isoform X2 [Oratosquilla oratoria]|uniref:coiled isoform X2 n=1 Tax=Oratosquilla oratoria TaxID=337810 RepID=UPI003F76E5AE
MYKIIYSPLLLAAIIQSVLGLECYVCKDQDSNQGKCTTTVIPCAYGEDRCLSTIKWGSTPYWDTGAPMQYYISKQCATEKMCDNTIKELMTNCLRIWWKDWNCAECCQGDRCNYYITLGASSASSSVVMLFMSSIFALLLARYH